MAAVLLLGAVGAAAGTAMLQLHRFAAEYIPLPHVESLELDRVLFDMTPLEITLTVEWQKVERTVEAHWLLRDQTLWRRMHFADWDGVPPPWRQQGLSAMIDKYAHVFAGPRAWRRMSVHDWDMVPQSIRTMAYLRMVAYWADYEQVGADFGLQPSRMAQTIGAIVMSESWFEHRAVNENAWGNRDLGLAQCSDHCRHVLRELAERGEIGFVLAEEDYFNPWVGTRVATVWFARELQRAEGDVELAIRAYHRGMKAASEGEGEEYAQGVERRRTKYILNLGAPASWRYLAQEIARLS